MTPHEVLGLRVGEEDPAIPGQDKDGETGSRDLRKDVFKPFVRLDARNQDTGGTGLGLAIALDIARSHGGDIGLGESKAGGPAGNRPGAGVRA